MTDPRQHRRTERGWSAAETMVAIGMVATGLMVLVQQMSISMRESGANEDRAFAYQKAASLLGEVQNSIALGKITKGAELMGLTDSKPQVVLTTRLDPEGLPFAADHPMSGNLLRQNHWAWARRIEVVPGEESGLYMCHVEILRWGDNQRWESAAAQALQFSLLPQADAPEQAFDVYLLACGAAPPLHGDLAELKAHMQSAAAAVQLQSQANVRLHWITRLGYGRDPCYAPYVNVDKPADAYAPMAYWYPGALGDGAPLERLYRSELLGGLHSTENGMVGGYTPAAPLPVTVADQWNHCLREPAARALFDRRLAAGLERLEEPPLQLLLQDMADRPERFRNAIFVNLHGAGLPMPPLRNFADAAREPVAFPGVRVVTHPARLQTPRDPDGNGNHADTQDLELRVHAFRTQGGMDVLAAPVLVQIFGADLTGNINGGPTASLTVHRLAGGVNTTTGIASGIGCDYVGFDEPGGVAPPTGENPFSMRFAAGFVGGANPYTWLELYNTPLCAPPVGTRGLQAAARLYGYDYSPAAIDGTFARDLAHDCAALEMRNTARWRIRIPRQAFVAGLLPNTDHVLRIVTRIGADTRSGTRWPVAFQPLNQSETWAWWTRAASAVPVTERCQFLGDPRLCPYADLTATATSFPHGYNWHFDDFVNGGTDARSQWPCFQPSRLQDGFGLGCRADAPRFLQLLRQDLQKCGAVLALPLGPTARTLLFGGEIACAPTGIVGPITVDPLWTGKQTASVDTITPGPGTGARLLVQSSATRWWAKPWLGELFPDEQWPNWFATGNLPLAAGPFHWQLAHTAAPPSLPLGTAFTAPQGALLGDAGAIMLLDCGTPQATFGTPAGGVTAAQPTVAQNEMNVATNLVPPFTVPSTYRVGTDLSGAAAPPCFAFVDSYPRSTATMLQNLWMTPSVTVGAVVDCAQTAAERAFFVPWPIGPAELPMAEIAEQTLLGAIRAVHVGGTPGLAGRIVQLPRLQILEPATGSSLSPESITVRWKTDWRRFDDQTYTTAYPQGFTESEGDLVYRLLWSADEGATWVSALTGLPANTGVWPELDDRLADTGTGSESFTLAPAEPLPDGEYLLMVEAWRSAARCHNSSHRIRLLLKSAGGSPPR